MNPDLVSPSAECKEQGTSSNTEYQESKSGLWPKHGRQVSWRRLICECPSATTSWGRRRRDVGHMQTRGGGEPRTSAPPCGFGVEGGVIHIHEDKPLVSHF